MAQQGFLRRNGFGHLRRSLVVKTLLLRRLPVPLWSMEWTTEQSQGEINPQHHQLGDKECELLALPPSRPCPLHLAPSEHRERQQKGLGIKEVWDGAGGAGTLQSFCWENLA